MAKIIEDLAGSIGLEQQTVGKGKTGNLLVIDIQVKNKQGYRVMRDQSKSQPRPC